MITIDPILYGPEAIRAYCFAKGYMPPPPEPMPKLGRDKDRRRLTNARYYDKLRAKGLTTEGTPRKRQWLSRKGMTEEQKRQRASEQKKAWNRKHQRAKKV